MAGQAKRKTPTSCFDDAHGHESPPWSTQGEGEHAVKQGCHTDPRNHIHLDTEAKITALAEKTSRYVNEKAAIGVRKI